LKNDAKPELAEATIYETGTNRWREFDEWPPEEAKKTKLYLQADGKLSFHIPASADITYEEFVSNPADPVPAFKDITMGTPKYYMVDDQRFFAKRKDVLTYQTEVLSEDITLAGNIWAKLKVSTSETDADWVVKIIDVYPEDIEDEKMKAYQQLVRAEIMRGRFRNSFEHPEQFIPDEITDVNFELMDVLHTFKKGHGIMVHVQSSWFPLADRNPQKYVENIYKADEKDFVKATHRVYHSIDANSFLEIKIIN